MVEWHRLFGLVLTDYFTGSPYHVELEKDLSLKQQFVDVIIIEQGEGETLPNVPDGLDNLGPHNLLSYKSHQEPFDPWTLDELLGHYVNYRKQISPSMTTLLPSEQFRLYGISTRYPRKLSQITPLQPIKTGVYEVVWGSQQIRILVLSQIPPTEQNAIWQLFSAIPAHVQYGASHYQWHISNLSTLIYELYQRYRLEGIPMSYTVNDYYREFTRTHLDWLTPEERVKGLALEERIKDVPSDEVLKYLLSSERGKLSPEQIEAYLQKIRQNKNLE